MLLGVIASLAITNELSHGTIRPTFAAMPDRWRPLLAKPIVQVAIAIVVTVSIVVRVVADRRGHRRRSRTRSARTAPVPPSSA